MWNLLNHRGVIPVQTLQLLIIGPSISCQLVQSVEGQKIGGPPN